MQHGCDRLHPIFELSSADRIKRKERISAEITAGRWKTDFAKGIVLWNETPDLYGGNFGRVIDEPIRIRNTAGAPRDV